MRRASGWMLAMCGLPLVTLGVEAEPVMLETSFVTPIAPSPPPLARPGSSEPDPMRTSPQPQCIRVTTSPARADEPSTLQHVSFENVCQTTISLWYCDRRGCPRMTHQILLEPGRTSGHTARKDASPSIGGGDYVACPFPKSEYVRNENGWVCTKYP